MLFSSSFAAAAPLLFRRAVVLIAVAAPLLGVSAVAAGSGGTPAKPASPKVAAGGARKPAPTAGRAKVAVAPAVKRKTTGGVVLLAAPRRLVPALVKPAKKVAAAPVRKPLPAAGPSWWESASVEIVAAGRARINYEAGVVKATGLGALAPPTLSRSHAQDALDARQAAVADALRTLAVAVGRVRVTASTRVENLVVKNDEVRLRVDGVLEHAQVIEEAASPSGIYRVVVQVPLTGAGSVAEAVGIGQADAPAAPDPAAEKPAPEPAKPEYGLDAPVPAGATYTGLIVDCRGLGIVPCMSPKLYERGSDDEVYGTLPVSPEYANEVGIVGYPRSLEGALRLARVGDRPLVVRAIGCADQNRFCPILSRKDAERVRAANQNDRFLQRTAVVFIVDPL